MGRRRRAPGRAEGKKACFAISRGWCRNLARFGIGGFGKTPLLVWSLALEAAEPVVMPGVLLDLVALAPVMSLFEVPGPRCACAGAMAVAAKREATMRTEIARRLDRMGISSVDIGDATRQLAVWIWVPSAPATHRPVTAKTPFPGCGSLRFRVVPVS